MAESDTASQEDADTPAGRAARRADETVADETVEDDPVAEVERDPQPVPARTTIPSSGPKRRSEERREARQRRNRKLLIISGVVLVVVVWLVLAVMDLLAAREADTAAQQELATVQRELSLATFFDEERNPLPGLEAAEAEFERAGDHLDSIWVAPLRIIPVVGRQIRAVDAMSAAGADVSRILGDAVVDVDKIVPDPSALVDPANRVQTMQGLATEAGKVSDQIAGVDLGPDSRLIAPLKRYRDSFENRMSAVRAGLDDGEVIAGALAIFLEGPSRYLVLGANNAEMRSGSGMFLTAGVLDVSGGQLTLGDVQPTARLPVPPGVPLDPQYQELWGWLGPQLDFRQLGTTPRFDLTAQTAAKMWEARGGGPVNGVIVIDPVALSRLLRAIGPVRVGRTDLEPGYVLKYTLHDQYVRFRQERTEDRREDIAEVAAAAFAALSNGSWEPAPLVDGIRQSVRGRHIMVWSSDPEVQAGWEAAGVSGTVGPNDMMVSVLNRGANKLDWFLEGKASLDVDTGRVVKEAPDGTPLVRATLTIDLENSVPAGEPPYIAGPAADTGTAEGEYKGIVTATLPAWVRETTIEGVDGISVAGVDGVNVAIGGSFRLERAQKGTYTVSMLVPQSAAVTVLSSARVPPIEWTFDGDSWEDSSSQAISW